jgi:hypothetical protein
MMFLMKAALVTALVAGLASPAAAQQGPDQPGRMMMQGTGRGPMVNPGVMPCPGMMMQQPGFGPGAMMGMGPMMMGMGPMMGGPGQYIEGRIAFLKAELGITPEQEEAWKAYAGALRESASSMQAVHAQMMSAGMPASLPERMELHEAMMSAQLDALQALRETTVRLYEALSDEQRKIADNLMGMM